MAAPRLAPLLPRYWVRAATRLWLPADRGHADRRADLPAAQAETAADVRAALVDLGRLLGPPDGTESVTALARLVERIV